MVDERWYEKLESSIFTVINYRVKTALTGKVSKPIRFTTTGESDSVPYFPTCYIHELTPIEAGHTLDGSTINAVTETMEIIVYTRTRDECKLIMNEAVHQMKRLRFSITAMPIHTEDGKVFSGVCRFRRLIGADDTDWIGTV